MIMSKEDFERFFRLPFDEAIKYLEQKFPVPVENWNDLTNEEKYNAFWVAGLLQLDILQRLQETLKTALDKGSTTADFVKEARSILADSGWTGANKSRLELIFFQNIQTAYQVGRYEKMEAVKERRPYWQYVSVLDKGTTTTCRGLNNAVFPADSPAWKSIFPPNHFWCRSTVVSISRAEFQAEDLKLSDVELAKNFPPSEGFDFNPGERKKRTPPTTDGYDNNLKEAFNNFLRGIENE